jgi:magnesium-transporting ATPase (P-type)
MSTDTFIRTVIAGFFATFVMTIISFLNGGLGLPVIDVGHILKESFNHVHPGEPYSIFWGNMAYNVMGVMLALIWVAFLHQRIPGNWIFKGVVFGVMISIIAGAIVSPLAMLAGGDSVGMFYYDTWIPGRILIAGLIMHISYGLVLLLGLTVAGVDGMARST